MADEWIVDVISFQKIFGLCGLKCQIVEIWRDVMFEDDDGQRKCEYRARICEAGFAISAIVVVGAFLPCQYPTFGVFFQILSSSEFCWKKVWDPAS